VHNEITLIQGILSGDITNLTTNLIMTKISNKVELKRNLFSDLLELKQITGIDVYSKSLSSVEDTE
jgi:hypothetical protein